MKNSDSIHFGIIIGWDDIGHESFIYWNIVENKVINFDWNFDLSLEPYDFIKFPIIFGKQIAKVKRTLPDWKFSTINVETMRLLKRTYSNDCAVFSW